MLDPTTRRNPMTDVAPSNTALLISTTNSS
jgi:hypothetical protein